MNFFRGKRTYIFAGLTFIASAAGLVFDVPLKYAVYGIGMAVPVMFVVTRIGIKNTWNKAYKVYIDRADPKKIKTVKTEGTIPEWKD